jgi:carbonic anhydrase
VESEWNGFARTEKIPDYITNTYNSKFNNDKYFAPHQWKAEKIYWRSDSEHTIDGKRFPVEMQMEHRSSEFDSR